MQYVFIKKGNTQCTIGSGTKPQKLGNFSRIFVLKVTLQSVRLPLTVSYRKIGGAGCTIVAPPIILLPMSMPAPMSHIIQSLSESLKI